MPEEVRRPSPQEILDAIQTLAAVGGYDITKDSMMSMLIEPKTITFTMPAYDRHGDRFYDAETQKLDTNTDVRDLNYASAMPRGSGQIRTRVPVVRPGQGVPGRGEW